MPAVLNVIGLYVIFCSLWRAWWLKDICEGKCAILCYLCHSVWLHVGETKRKDTYKNRFSFWVIWVMRNRHVSSDWHLTFALTLVFTVQLLSLVVQILFSQMLDIQEPLDNFIHGSIYEGQSQVAQGVVRQPLLERANQSQQWIQSATFMNVMTAFPKLSLTLVNP